MTVQSGFRRWRKRHGLSQQRLARFLDCDIRTIVRWDHGENDPKVAAIRRLEVEWPGLVDELMAPVERVEG